MHCHPSSPFLLISTSAAYNAFIRYGQAASWCKSHALSFRAMSRAVSIRAQLKKYMHRFHLPIKSCEGDAKRLRQCLVNGYWQNSARLQPNGTYLSTHGNKVCGLRLGVDWKLICGDGGFACASSISVF